MWQTGCYAASVNNSRNTLRNILEEQGSHLHLGGSPNPRTVIYTLTLLMYQKLPYKIIVTVLLYRIINELFKAQSVQFGAESCVAPLAYFMGVNIIIAFFHIRRAALFWNYKICDKYRKTQYSVVYHLKLNSNKISNSAIADTVCVTRCQRLDAVTSTGEQKCGLLSLLLCMLGLAEVPEFPRHLICIRWAG